MTTAVQENLQKDGVQSLDIHNCAECTHDPQYLAGPVQYAVKDAEHKSVLDAVQTAQQPIEGSKLVQLTVYVLKSNQ